MNSNNNTHAHYSQKLLALTVSQPAPLSHCQLLKWLDSKTVTFYRWHVSAPPQFSFLKSKFDNGSAGLKSTFVENSKYSKCSKKQIHGFMLFKLVIYEKWHSAMHLELNQLNRDSEFGEPLFFYIWRRQLVKMPYITYSIWPMKRRYNKLEPLWSTIADCDHQPYAHIKKQRTQTQLKFIEENLLNFNIFFNEKHSLFHSQTNDIDAAQQQWQQQ